MSPDTAATAATHLPVVDRVLGWAPVAALIALHGRSAGLEAVRAGLAALRALQLQVGEAQFPIDQRALADAVAARVEAVHARSLRRSST